MRLSKTNHATAEDHAIVTAAIAEAEVATSGEIVTIVTDLSDHYQDMAAIWATIAAFLALTCYALFPAFYLDIIHFLTGGWEHDYSVGEYLGLVFVALALKWIGTWAILQYVPIRLALTPRHIKLQRVRARALSLFRVGTEAKTVGRTGVLLYLSMKEHRAEIVADEAIASKVSPEIWGDAMVALLEEVREGRVGAGMAEAVRQMGIVLAEHFPKGSENPNELPDRLIEL
jgi:putative membrane protein